MKIIDDLIATIDGERSVVEVHTCVFWTAVITGPPFSCGLASSLKQDSPIEHHKKKVRDVGKLTNKSTKELSGFAYSDNLLEAAIGMATINSLLTIDESLCVEQNAFDVLARKGEGKNIAVVGHYPFVPKLKALAKNLWVIEKNPKEGDLPEKAAEEKLPQADVVCLTGTSLLNKTFDSMIKLCYDKFVVMVGPTTPLSTVLFDYGIDVISGSKIIDRKKVIQCISQGATFQQVQGVKLLTLQK
jgi:uncharacterized protein (DUF4213/DUF364 family)